MRILEIGLMCIDFVILLYLLWFQPRHKKYLLLGAVLLISFLSAHLLMEGDRWTMLPLYAATGILLFLIALKIIKFKPIVKKHSFWRYTGYLLLFIFIAAGAFLSAALPVFRLPTPTGQYTVGTQTLHFIDSSRPETLTDDVEDRRELMVQVWYPAQTSQEKKKDLLFMRDEPLFTDLMTQYGNSLRVPGFALSYWKYIGANSYQKANIQPSAAPYPVILISHGLGTGKMLHTSQAENLASHGYIVMGIDHTYSSAATLFPDGTITSFTTELPNENFQQEAGELEQIWLADIKYILQQLQPLNEGHIQEATSFQHQIDLNHIGIMGHSFGGATAYDALKANPELIAGINMDGTLTNSDEPDDKSEGNKPFLFLFSDSFVKNSAQLSANTSIPQEARQLLEKEQRIIRHTIQQGGYGVHIQGTEHFNYTDLQLYSDLLKYTGMTGEIDGKRGSELVNKLILQFFDQALKGTATPPWSELSSTYPEVEMYQP